MEIQIIPKVFVLCYDYSEEDHGILDIYSSFEAANDAKKFLETEFKSRLGFFRFRIDVYEVYNNLESSKSSIIFGCFGLKEVEGDLLPVYTDSVMPER